MPRSHRIGLTAVIVVVATATAACGRESSPSTATTAPSSETTLATTPSGLAATLEQYREDQITHTIQIQAVNLSTRTVQLADLRLSWPGFTDTAAGPRTEFVGPGQVLDLPVPLGDAVCSDPPRADAPVPSAPAVATASATWDDGTREQVRIPITDTRGVLPRVFKPDCQRQSVVYAASVSFDPTWTDTTTADGRPAVNGTFRLHRGHGTDPVSVSAINGSVLLAIAPATPATSAPLLTLAADATDATLVVVVTESGRCEAHALAESKHTFFLPASVTVGDAPTVLVDVIPDDAAKLQLSKMINRTCGVG